MAAHPHILAIFLPIPQQGNRTDPRRTVTYLHCAFNLRAPSRSFKVALQSVGIALYQSDKRARGAIVSVIPLLAYLKSHHKHYTLNSSEPNAIPSDQKLFVNQDGAMAFVKITAIFALFTFPFALAHTVHPAPPDKIPYLCLQLGLPHLFVAFSPKATRNASIGIAFGSSLLLFIGLSLITLFGWFLKIVVFESVPGERDAIMWPWILASAAHGAMCAAAIFADRANKRRISVPMYGFIGFAYSAVSILLAAR
jgi:hypothetical protein